MFGAVHFLSPDTLYAPYWCTDMNEEGLKQAIIAHGEVPQHIAFIMDGNGRWAQRRGLPRIAGHRQGVKSVRRMVETGPEIGVKVMTFYTFSTENWLRPQLEVSALMQLLLESIEREVDDLIRNEVSLRVIGDLGRLPEAPRRAMRQAIERTAGLKRMILVLALSYSGRGDIIQAINRIINSGVTAIDERTFADYLDTAGLPDPDLLIRTSGELRLSNFLLYQLAYTEIFVTDRYWPDFQRRDLFEAIHSYQQRERRFGKISEQVRK